MKSPYISKEKHINTILQTEQIVSCWHQVSTKFQVKHNSIWASHKLQNSDSSWNVCYTYMTASNWKLAGRPPTQNAALLSPLLFLFLHGATLCFLAYFSAISVSISTKLAVSNLQVNLKTVTEPFLNFAPKI